jgi:hypothetical protein
MQYLTGRRMPARFVVTGDIHPRRRPSTIMVPLRHGAGMSIFDLRLETERLILRPLLREDYEPYLAFCADEERCAPSVACSRLRWPGAVSAAWLAPGSCSASRCSA